MNTDIDKDRDKFASRIPGVICRPLVQFHDSRGWLAEIFRQDELLQDQMPVMAYLSVTQPGVGRGPHAHREQTDLFCFPGPGEFRLTLWDQRPESPANGLRQDFVLGENSPGIVIIPPGVVHGYRNLSDHPGLVCNFANRLYRGPGRAEPADEIRFENDPDSPFQL